LYDCHTALSGPRGGSAKTEITPFAVLDWIPGRPRQGHPCRIGEPTRPQHPQHPLVVLERRLVLDARPPDVQVQRLGDHVVRLVIGKVPRLLEG